MNKRLQSSIVAMATVVMSAWCATASAETVTFVSSNPANNSTVEKIEGSIWTDWTGYDADWGLWTSKSTSSVTVKKDGAFLCNASLRNQYGGNQQAMIKLPTDYALITEPGVYTFTIAADMIRTMDAASYGMSGIEGTGNAETVITLTIPAPVVKVAFESSTPENNSTVASIDGGIWTNWTGYEPDWGLWSSKSATAVTVARNGEFLCNATLRTNQGGVQQAFIKLPTDFANITEPGTYTFTIAPDMVMKSDSEKYGMSGVEGTGNLETVITLTIPTPVEKVAFVSADPENNSTLERIDGGIWTNWSGYEADWGLWSSKSATAVTVARNGEFLCNATLRTNQGGVQQAFIKLPTDFASLTESGTYTFTIAPDMIMKSDGEKWGMSGVEGTGNIETVLTYNIEISNGVANIVSEGEAEYFTTGGVRVDAASLPAGIYIKKTAGKTVKVAVK